eukprot:CAMPEP_0182858056 /NCGR_PEP_ID=MMETSP0034_2-20130328/3437_1 /TAXON_ID=156128 /ORGANISM="Nephroselmis pyriformis, Strain CCMP717" /LENGTH=460 /DNA_ID=CAMNT_0024989399 /DNA_START=120 /DNA_END=1502 /DNA_ORIENTATION=-
MAAPSLSVRGACGGPTTGMLRNARVSPARAPALSGLRVIAGAPRHTSRGSSAKMAVARGESIPLMETGRKAVQAALVAAPAVLVAPGYALAHEGPAVDPTDPAFIAQLGLVAGMLALGQYFAVKEEAEEAEKEAEEAEMCEADPGKCVVEAAGEEEPLDIWRDTPIRYLGYSNELGEAFRPLVGGLANLTYIVAIGYVLADAFDKTNRAKGKSMKSRAAGIFKRLDTGGEGYLTFEEVRTAFRDLRVPLSRDQIEEFIATADTKKNGRIEFDEFLDSIERADFQLGLLLEAGEKGGDWGKLAPSVDKYSVIMGLDALFWQIIASVAMPGFAINRVVSLTAALQPEGSYVPTVVGLAMIPFVVKPLDVLADVLLEVTLRPLVFASLDIDKDHYITLDELRAKLMARDDDLPEDMVVELLSQLDTDKDGKVSMDEWSADGFQTYKKWCRLHNEGTLSESGLY